MVADRWLLLLAAAALAVPATVLTLLPRPAIVAGAITAAYAGALVVPAQKGPLGPPVTGDIARARHDGAAPAVLAGSIPIALATPPTADAPITPPTGFRLRATMRQGTASGLAAVWERYQTIDAARAQVRGMYANDRVSRVHIVTDDVPPRFVEWIDR
jgi:hypothetical protein